LSSSKWSKEKKSMDSWKYKKDYRYIKKEDRKSSYDYEEFVVSFLKYSRKCAIQSAYQKNSIRFDIYLWMNPGL